MYIDNRGVIVMQIQKKIEDIKSLIVMCGVQCLYLRTSLWHLPQGGMSVQSVRPRCGGMIVPYDRYTDYYATPEEPEKCWRS